MLQVVMRRARRSDADAINFIFNQAIEDGNASLDIDKKEQSFRQKWLASHDKRHPVFVGELYSEVVCWVALSPYARERYPYDGVADLSVYVRRDLRGKGLGTQLLKFIEQQAMELGFYKIMLSVYSSNRAALHAYRRAGFRDVGIFRNHGYHKGKLLDIVVMERLLTPDMERLKAYYCENYPFYAEYFAKEQAEEEEHLRRNGVLPATEKAAETPAEAGNIDESGLPEGIVRFLKSKQAKPPGPVGYVPSAREEELEKSAHAPPVIVLNTALQEEAVRQKRAAMEESAKEDTGPEKTE